MGENGGWARSTLYEDHVASMPADGGEMFVDGHPVAPEQSRAAARIFGIGIIPTKKLRPDENDSDGPHKTSDSDASRGAVSGGWTSRNSTAARLKTLPRASALRMDRAHKVSTQDHCPPSADQKSQGACPITRGVLIMTNPLPP